MRRIGIIEINEQAEKIPNCIRFDKGSSKFPLPEEVVPHFHKAIENMRDKYCHYPNTGGEPKLKQLIAEIEKKNNRQVSAENITITHGGTSGLFTALSCLTRPGDEIITSQYCFELLSLLTSHFGLTQIRTDFSQIDEVKKAITQKTKLIIFNSPENPTGKVYSQKKINDLAELVEYKKIWLLSDEVMHGVVYNNTFWYGPSTDNERVVTINSFSKTWFMPGGRIGWITSKDKRLAELFGNSLSMQTEGVSLFSQFMMAEALKSIGYEGLLAKRMIILNDYSFGTKRYCPKTFGATKDSLSLLGARRNEFLCQLRTG